MKYLLSTTLVLLLLLISCGGGSENQTALTWWQFWTNPEVKPTIDSLATEFESDHSDVDVQLGDLTWSDGHEKIVISLAAGKGPDVIELGSDWVCEFAAAGKLLDITAAVADLKDDLQMWEPVTYKGRIYGVPWLLGTRVLFCNSELIEAATGERVPPSRWQDLLEMSQDINALGDDIHGFGSNSAERHRLYKKYLPFFWSAGGQVFNSTQTATNFKSRAGRESLTFYLQLAHSGLTDTQARLDDYFTSGKLGFVISGDWLIRKIARENPNLDYTVTYMPNFRKLEPGVSFAGGEYLVINADTKNPEQAIELLKYLVQPEQNARFCAAAGSFTAANKRAPIAVPPEQGMIAHVFTKQLLLSRPSPVHPKWVYLEEALEKGIEQALYGQILVEEALRQIDSSCTEILGQ